MTTSKKNIAIIIPTFDIGGVSAVAINLMKNLDDSKFNKFFILYDGSINDYEINTKIIDLRTPTERSFFKKISIQFKRYFRLKKAKIDNKIDISISFKDNTNLTNIFTRKNDKVIITVHTNPSKDYSKLHGKIYKILINLFFKKSDKIVVVSEGIKTDLVDNYHIDKKNIQVIYNFIDTKYIQQMNLEPIEEKYDHLFDQDKTIINVGRLSRAKGQWHLIRAFSKVLEQISNSKLLIIGDGDYSSYLNELITKLNLKNSVFLLGYQKNPFNYMKHSDLFVLSSIYEGFGLVLIEAMACGLPVISTNCRSGPEEIIADIYSDRTIADAVKEKYGILIPTPDGKEYKYSKPLTEEENILADEIILVLKNKELKNKYIAQSELRTKDFSSDNIIPQWEKLFEEIYKG
ncbi:MAG: glycosyltransferase [Candidatus Delongbacteria bacterium]|jgi:glycosyltransferase involved in cell wall biosynthesis|nr:glycosyltransferase [Candidatus Delongbacteria bacterium]